MAKKISAAEERQLQRDLLLRTLWSAVLDENERRHGLPAWLESELRGTEPGDETGNAARRLVDAGVDLDDLTDLVRDREVGVLLGVCQILEGRVQPEMLGIHGSKDLPKAAWRVFRVDADDPGTPLEPYLGIHEEIVDMDPTGRCGEPRERGS